MLQNIPAELVWFILGLVLLLLEIATPGFILAFFGLGAWATSLATFLGATPRIDLQILIFLAVSIFTLVLFRKKALRSRGRVATKQHEAHNMDTMAGSLATVTEDIQPGSRSGRVELFGTSWQAISDEPIKKGNAVEIVSRDNLILKVKIREK